MLNPGVFHATVHTAFRTTFRAIINATINATISATLPTSVPAIAPAAFGRLRIKLPTAVHMTGSYDQQLPGVQPE
ncbi:MAG: hypothetical protein ACK5JO_02380 [Halodesulfovibrio sp.]